MITNLSLGSGGRLGNQMFQYAMLVGIKHKLGFEIMIDEEIDKKSIYGHCELVRCFSLRECHFYNKSGIYAPNHYSEERFDFDRRFFKKIDDNTNFDGYFQSEKYFEHCKDTVRKEFVFKDEIQKQAKEFCLPMEGKRLVSIHVRRGDYVSLPGHHPLCGVEYYEKAMSHFSEDVQYICFSDDITWCRNNLPSAKNLIFSENTTGVDLCIMSMCNDNIIANSSFSWWGAWLNPTPDKKVIAPKVWFGTFYSHYDTSDLYCKEWVRV